MADSDAGAEWAECLLKASFLRKADPGLKLIETLRREEGGYPRLKSHLERLRRSAHWLGFAFDEPALLERLASQPATGLWRVRGSLMTPLLVLLFGVVLLDCPLFRGGLSQRLAVEIAHPVAFFSFDLVTQTRRFSSRSQALVAASEKALVTRAT